MMRLPEDGNDCHKSQHQHQHQVLIYRLLMRCSWETVRTFSGNDKQLQGTPGATAVLYTHTTADSFFEEV